MYPPDNFEEDILQSKITTKSSNSYSTAESVNKYNDVLSNILDKHVPIKTKEVTVRQNTSWYTLDVGIETRKEIEY